ncbi:MAG: flagellar motor protein MotB [Alphaproteobacteria bacterium]|nr:MAG: flagellar motor protein MotB [Alphaproteobacteria bacterium]
MRFAKFVAAAALVAGLSACASGRGPARETIVATPSDCRSQTFEVYFADGEARLTETARQVIGMTATHLQGCDIQRVQVIGLADASGPASLNQNLSQRRATAVAEALAAAGWPTPVFEVAAAGGQGATVAPGVTEPLRRRTEVMVTAAPR